MPNDVPLQSYYPRVALRLTIRFEEYGRPVLQKKVPTKTTKNLDGVKVDRADLKAVPDPTAPGGIKRLLLLPAGSDPTTATSPQAQARSSDGLTFDVSVIPKDVNWQQNGIREADQLTATIRYIDVPLDPRVIRSCAVEALIGVVDEDTHAAQNEGKAPPGAPVLPDTYTDDQGRQRTNLRFQGFVEDWKVMWSDSEPVIKLECRDNTRLLMNQECPPRLVLDMTKGIDEAIATYLTHFPAFAGLSVEYKPAGDTPPILKDVLQNTSFRPRLGPQPSRGGGASGEKLSVWDYLTDICGSIGHAVYVAGTVITVQKVRSFTTSSGVSRADDPFQGRTVGDESFNYRRMIYGRNLSEMNISRKYAKNVPANIEVRCYSTERKTVLVARFPLPSDRQVYALPGNAAPDQKWNVIRVSGIKDDKTLRAIAQTVYESQGRNELQIDLKTRNLASFGGGNSDPDLLDMRPGDTFELLVNRDDDEVNTLTNIEKALTAQSKNAELMKALGFDSDFADTYAKVYTDSGFLTQFKLKQMQLDWSVDDGVSISLVGVNYIEVRADKLLPQGEETSATAVQ